MPLPTTALLPTAKTWSTPLLLEHRVFPLDNVQRRFAGRVAMMPAVDLDAWRFEAVIDWIEFRVCFGRSTQVQHVQPVLRKFLDRDSYIQPDEKGPGGTLNSCRIKVQEPRNLALIYAIHQRLVEVFGEAAGASVTGIEISVDMYAREHSYAACVALLGALQRTIWTNRDICSNKNSRPRISFGKEKRETQKLSPKPEKDGQSVCRTVPENHTIPAGDATMYLGAQSDDVMIRLMHKVIDRQQLDGSSTALADEEKRVRVEATLRGSALLETGITNIASLRQLKLAPFQRQFFQFRLPMFRYAEASNDAKERIMNCSQTWDAETYLRSGVTGLTMRHAAQDAQRKLWMPGVREHIRLRNPGIERNWTGTRLRPPFVAWQQLNRKISDALSRLDKREATAWRRMDT